MLLKRILLISVLLIVLVLTGVAARVVLRFVVSATLGSDMVQSGVFYLAVVALSVIVFSFLIVFAIRTWGKLRNSLPQHSKPSKH